MTITTLRSVLLALAFLTAGCQSIIPEKLADEPPPLADMEEPVPLLTEPDDEESRRELPTGSFTGIVIGRAWASLEEATTGDPGVSVKRVVENSPADAAGIEPGDVLLAVLDSDGAETDLAYPSQWRKLELETPPGTEVEVILDRGGVERSAKLTLIPRVRPPDRAEADRYREEERVGVVLRTATEVEARAVGLGPGGGAVVVGLSRASPWRKAGIRYGDLVVEVDGKSVDHPQVVLDAIRDAKKRMTVEIVRKGKRKTRETRLTSRKGEVDRVNVPPLFDYEDDRGDVDLSILLGLVKHRATAAAWEWRILWIFRFRGGDSDRLREVDE